jgi:hypothetical protein
MMSARCRYEEYQLHAIARFEASKTNTGLYRWKDANDRTTDSKTEEDECGPHDAVDLLNVS